MTLVFGLTGGIASGKSTVSRRMTELGIPMIDADVLAREVVLPGTPGWAAVKDRFGAEVLRPDGTLDRPKLGARVFENRDELAALNAIVHPLVRQRFEALAREVRRAGHDLLGYEVPLLFENRMEERLRPVVLVATPEAKQIERLRTRNGLTQEQALARLRAQLPLDEKLARADLVLWNDRDPKSLEQSVDDLVRELRERAAQDATQQDVTQQDATQQDVTQQDAMQQDVTQRRGDAAPR